MSCENKVAKTSQSQRHDILPCVDTCRSQGNRVGPTTGDLRHHLIFQGLHKRWLEFVDPITVAQLPVFAASKCVEFSILRHDCRMKSAAGNLLWAL